jgi:hypothetical protein
MKPGVVLPRRGLWRNRSPADAINQCVPPGFIAAALAPTGDVGRSRLSDPGASLLTRRISCQISNAERVFTDQTSNKTPCGMYVAALTIRAVRAEHLIQAKGIERSISARNGVLMSDRACQKLTRSIRRSRTCPRVCLAGEWAPWTRTPDEVTSSGCRVEHRG